MTDPRTLQELISQAARRAPDGGVSIFDRRGRSFERRTYPEILDAARTFAGRWSNLGVGPGDPVLVSLPTSWDWMDAWTGAALLGALPVALAPAPPFGAAEGHIRKVEAILEVLDGSRVVVSDAVAAEAERLGRSRVAGATVTPSTLAAAPVGSIAPARPDPGDVAFLQLTSGSTGLPRAVMIPHRAIVHNTAAIDHAVGAPRGTSSRHFTETIVSWLPLHHDMGLVGCLLLALRRGFELSLFQPATFLARPHRWLEALGAGPTSMTTAPNFAYQLCAERISPQQLEGLDLSVLQNAMTGAEMIRPETVEAFHALFGPRGFGPSTFRPCYGLAEATLAVTFDQSGGPVRTRPAPSGAGAGLGLQDVVCNGRPVLDTEVRITGPDGRPLPDAAVGTVRVRGPGVFAGYYRDPEATAWALRDGWLDTGDLGFLLDGELYLTGRTKDVLIIRGHNIMPHELEWLAESATGGGGAIRAGAFSIARGPGGEEAVLAVEVMDDQVPRIPEIAEAIHAVVGRELSLILADVVFVRRGRLPRTTSGKVRRLELRQQYVDGTLERLEPDPSTVSRRPPTPRRPP